MGFGQSLLVSKYPNMEYIYIYMASLFGVVWLFWAFSLHSYIYIYMASVLGIVIMVWGIYFIFGYLDPYGMFLVSQKGHASYIAALAAAP